MTTLSSLFIVCSHGRRSAHGPFDTKGESLLPGGWCQGGRPATLEDLEGLGERYWRCVSTHGFESIFKPPKVGDPWHSLRYDNGGQHTDECGWRILIPLPQMVAVHEKEN